MLHAPPLHRVDSPPPRIHLLKPAAEPANPLDQLFDVRLLARRRVLILDYDGTLAPLRAPAADGRNDRGESRFAAAPYAGTRELLARIRAHPAARLVFVSGRPAREMADMLALSPRPEIFGVHGWEHLTRSGQLVRAIVPAQARARLDEVRALHARFDAAGAVLEDKHAAIAVHWRGRGVEQVREIRALLAPFEAPADAPARLDGVFLQPFDGGIEVRAHGPSKGSIVRSVLREETRDAVVAYFGDDLSDEEAFRALGTRGIGVRVLPAAAPRDAARRPTHAQLTLRAPDELHAFLARWTEQPGAPGWSAS
jgi:trehalose 6-phosphate synthase/trehalose 6-phosphate phosphatase